VNVTEPVVVVSDCPVESDIVTVSPVIRPSEAKSFAFTVRVYSISKYASFLVNWFSNGVTVPEQVANPVFEIDKLYCD
jgi:hypothetical protein